MNTTSLKHKAMAMTAALLLSFLGLTAVATAQVTGNNWFKVTPVDDTKAVNVFVNTNNSDKYSVKLMTASGFTIWSSGRQTGRFEKSLVLDQMDQGKYIVSVTVDDVIVEQPFMLEDGKAVIDNSMKYLSGPTVAVIGKAVLVDFPTGSDGAEVTVRIYDEGGDEVFANAIVSESNRVTRYDMNALPTGRYQMIFDTGSASFERNVTLKAK